MLLAIFSLSCSGIIQAIFPLFSVKVLIKLDFVQNLPNSGQSFPLCACAISICVMAFAGLIVSWISALLDS